MLCFGGNNSDTETTDEAGGKKPKEDQQENATYVWHPTIKNTQKIAYVRQLEKRYESLQAAYFNLSAECARLQACLTQIVRADACERDKLIAEVKNRSLETIDFSTFPTMEQHSIEMGSLHRKQQLLMDSLRQQIGSFEQAFENLDINEEVLPVVEVSQNSLLSESSAKAVTCCKLSRVKETPSVKITKYVDDLEPGTSAESANSKPEKSKKLYKLRNKLKNNPKSSVPVATATKSEDVHKIKDKKTADGILNETPKSANSKSLPAYKKALSTETLNSGSQSIISTRSASFKELRAKYQPKKGPAK